MEVSQKDRNPFELVIGLVGGLGTNFDKVYKELESAFKSANCLVKKIKVTKYLTLQEQDNVDFLDNLEQKIKKMNEAREQLPYGIASYLAILFIHNDRIKRSEIKSDIKKPVVYIVDSLKHPDEYQIFRDVYRRNFVLLSVYESKESRKENLLNQQLYSITNNLSELHHEQIEELMNTDESEGITHGRDTLKTYHKAHYFIHSDYLNQDIERFVNLLFNIPFTTPSKDEVAMMYAYVSSLRSSDISRQVGAVIIDDDGNIIASGCNEVPKFGGGLYWDNINPDLRDWKTVDCNRVPIGEKLKLKSFKNYLVKTTKNPEKLSNKELKLFGKSNRTYILYNNKIYYVDKNANLMSLIINKPLNNDELEKIFPKETDKLKLVSLDEFRKFEEFTGYNFISNYNDDSLEYIRAVHAEEAAICDAAKRGVSIKNTTLYTTTFPCHLCTKHIIAAGIHTVVYIEPYPKSMAEDLFENMVKDKASIDDLNMVKFYPFRGVSPKRYKYIFSKSKLDRRDRVHTERIISWNLSDSEPIYLSHSTPLAYFWVEKVYIDFILDKLRKVFDIDNLLCQMSTKKLQKLFDNYIEIYGSFECPDSKKK
ncbi:deaminase [Legionella londiniensis]|nr:deaminase [Legionella londiniensis]